jgi:hypothetical protein
VNCELHGPVHAACDTACGDFPFLCADMGRGVVIMGLLVVELEWRFGCYYYLDQNSQHMPTNQTQIKSDV